MIIRVYQGAMNCNELSGNRDLNVDGLGQHHENCSFEKLVMTRETLKNTF